MWKIAQNGPQKGTLESKPYGFNIQDQGFWDKCWLWQKDTVGANGLYPFQIGRYEDRDSYGLDMNDQKRAIEIQLPEIKYPDDILKLYKY